MGAGQVVWEATDLPAQTVHTAVLACAQMHQIAQKVVQAEAVRTGLHTVVTSADFVELLHCVRRLLAGKRSGLQTVAEKYTRGVSQMKHLQEKARPGAHIASGIFFLFFFLRSDCIASERLTSRLLYFAERPLNVVR